MKKNFNSKQFFARLQKDGIKKEIDSSEEKMLVSPFTDEMFKFVFTDEIIRKNLLSNALKVLNEAWGKSFNQ